MCVTSKRSADKYLHVELHDAFGRHGLEQLLGVDDARLFIVDRVTQLVGAWRARVSKMARSAGWEILKHANK